MNKSFLFALLLCIISYANVFAQNFDEARLENMTNEFIQRAESSDAVSLMTNIKSYYSSQSSNNKKIILSFYVAKVSSLLENEKKNEALAVIHLYQNLADKDDEKLPSLMFVKGNIYTEKMDSLHLKQTLLELSNDALKEKPGISDYLSKLSANLDKIRKYIPPYKKLDGIWVADGLIWDKGKKNRIANVPFRYYLDFMLDVVYDSNADTLSFVTWPSCNLASEITSNITVNALTKTPDWRSSQLIVPYASDSIYVLWSSEKLNKNSPEVASFFRGTVSATAAAVSAELAQSNKHSFSSQLLGGIATTVGEIGLNAVISALFTPTKNMFTLEGKLKMANDHLMTGTLTYKYRSIAADGDVYEDKILQTNVSLIRWQPESNVLFCEPSYLKDHIWMPIIMMPHSANLLNYQELFSNENFNMGFPNTRYAYCEEKIGKKVKLMSNNSSEGVKALKAYNNDQYKWLMLYNDSILRSQGSYGEFAINDNTQPYLGIRYSSLDVKMQKKLKLAEGVYIDEVDEMSAAYVGGLNKGDIIISVNGQMTKDKDDMDMMIDNIKVGDWLSFHVLRGKKTMDLSIRVTWK